jgi:hypothetical protein
MKMSKVYDTHWHKGDQDAQEIDPSPRAGSTDYREKAIPHRSHIGGVGEGHRDSGLAHNHTGDFIGEHNPDDMSRAGEDSLRILGIMPEEHEDRDQADDRPERAVRRRR